MGIKIGGIVKRDRNESILRDIFVYWEYRGFLIARSRLFDGTSVMYEAVRPWSGDARGAKTFRYSTVLLELYPENIINGVHQDVLDWITEWSIQNMTISEETAWLKSLDDRSQYSKWKEATGG